MAAKPSISLVGAGNIASALGIGLRKAGYRIVAIHSRPNRGSLRRARALARRVGAIAGQDTSEIGGDILWFCVPDSEINKAARLFRTHLNHDEWRGKIAFHSSGVLTSDELRELRRAGAAVASVHPLMTFVPRSRPALKGVAFAIEGDLRAVAVARQLVRELGGYPYSIRKQDKPAYHACCTFASPLLTALLASTEELALLSGMTRKGARKRLLPILQQTVANFGSFGAPAAFSGPIIRGDIATVQRHLQQLREHPEIRNEYIALARAALKFLPVKDRESLVKILEKGH